MCRCFITSELEIVNVHRYAHLQTALVLNYLLLVNYLCAQCRNIMLGNNCVPQTFR